MRTNQLDSPESPAIPLPMLHLIVGVLGLAAFVGTGQYMRWTQGGLKDMPDGPRLFYRSAHIYLLWSSLLNLMLGCYVVTARRGILRLAQTVGSVVLLLGPFLLCASFFFERHSAGLTRPMGRMAILTALAGAVLHAVTAKLSRRNPAEG